MILLAVVAIVLTFALLIGLFLIEGKREHRKRRVNDREFSAMNRNNRRFKIL